MSLDIEFYLNYYEVIKHGIIKLLLHLNRSKDINIDEGFYRLFAKLYNGEI